MLTETLRSLLGRIIGGPIRFRRKLVIRPDDTRSIDIVVEPNQYATLFAYMQEHFMAGIAVHSISTSGKAHNHLSIYLADPGGEETGAEGRGRQSKLDVQFGKEVPFMSMEDMYFGFKPNKNTRGGGFVWIHPDSGDVYEVDIDAAVSAGVLRRAPVSKQSLYKPGIFPMSQ